jgi:hypothetical protein
VLQAPKPWSCRRRHLSVTGGHEFTPGGAKGLRLLDRGLVGDAPAPKRKKGSAVSR